GGNSCSVLSSESMRQTRTPFALPQLYAFFMTVSHSPSVKGGSSFCRLRESISVCTSRLKRTSLNTCASRSLNLSSVGPHRLPTTQLVQTSFFMSSEA